MARMATLRCLRIWHDLLVYVSRPQDSPVMTALNKGKTSGTTSVYLKLAVNAEMAMLA